MATSAVGICNLALSRLGHAQVIASLDEESTAASLCNVHYDPTREAMLRDWPYPFSRKWADLALVEEDPNDEWGYAFREPSGSLRVLRVLNPLIRGASVVYAKGADDGGGLIYTDSDTAACVYIDNITNPGLFPADFVQAFAWRLAAELAVPLAQNAGLRATMETAYLRALSAARATSAQDGVADPAPESEFITGRE